MFARAAALAVLLAPSQLPAAGLEGGLPGGGMGLPGIPAGAPAPSPRDSEIAWAQGLTVVRVDVEGIRVVKLDTVISALTTRVGDPFAPASVRQDVKNIWAQGYYDDVRVEASAEGGGVRLTYRVLERPSVKDVQIEGLKSVKEKELREAIEVKAGSVYTQRTVDEAKRKFLKFLREKGWYAAQVEEQVFAYEREHAVILRFKIDQGAKVKVRRINVVGNKAVKDKVLKAQMDTKPYLFLLSDGAFKEETWRADMEKVAKHYKSLGYLEARVLTPEFPENVRWDTRREFMTLYLHVHEGPRYRIRVLDLTLSDPTVLSEQELRLRCVTRPGDVFRLNAWEEDFQRLRLAYADRGYIYAQLEPGDPEKCLKVHPEDHTVSIKVSVTEGPAARIAWVKLSGNEATKDDVVFREVLLNDRGVCGPDGKPRGQGDIFDITRLRRSQEKLMSLGYFDEVTPDTERSEHAGEENLVFNVKERKTGTISVGGGYSSRDKLLFYSQVAENNLFGNGQRISADWNVGRTLNQWSIGFFEPWLFPKDPIPLDAAGHRDFSRCALERPLEPTSFAIDVWHRKYGTTADHPFDELNTGASVSLGRQLGQWMHSRLTYKYEHTDIRADARLSLPYGERPGFYNTSSLIGFVGYDTRDIAFQPSRGYFAGITAHLAGGVLRGDRDFVKVAFDTSRHWTLIRSRGEGKPLLVFSGHLRVGWGKPSTWPRVDAPASGEAASKKNLWDYVLPYRTAVDAPFARLVPASDQFSVGGIDTVRGFNEAELSEEILVLPDGSVLRRFRQTTMVLANLELHFPIADPFRGIFFVDIGRGRDKFGHHSSWGRPSSWLDKYDDYYTRGVRPWPPPPHIPFGVAFGPGLRILIPGTMMLIRFDYGFPIRNQYKSLSEVLKSGNPAFSIGNLF